MRSTMLPFLLLCLALAAVGAQRQRRQAPAAPSSQQSAEDRQLADQRAIARLQERAIAAHSTFDVDALAAIATDDVVLLPPGREPVIGLSALRSFYQHEQEQAPTADVLAYSENWEEVRIVGDYAFQWGTITERVKPSLTAAETTSAAHAMRVLARQPDGSWKIARFIWNNAAAAGSSN